MKKPGSYQSPETGFAALPKAIKIALTTSGQSAPVAATPTTLLFDDPPKFNYGPYAFHKNGVPYIDGVYLTEPGIYDVHAQIGWIANSQLADLQLALNGSAVWRDGTAAQFYTGATLSNGSFNVAQQCRQIAECQAGDLISVVMDQLVGPTATVAGYGWLYIEKKEGRT